MKALKITIEGRRPLLMHNARLADRRDEITRSIKALTSKKKKTDEDADEVTRLEWLGGLYIDEKGPFLPAVNIESAIIEAARITKMGKQVERANVSIVNERVRLVYDGPKSADALYKKPGFVDVRSVKVQQSRVMRARPIFMKWATEAFVIGFDAETINGAELLGIIAQCGKMVGLGDYRRRYGRFVVAKSEEITISDEDMFKEAAE